MLNEIEYANLKGLITSYGQADSETISARLSWGPERLAGWITRSPAYQGYELGQAEMDALSLLCAEGIRLPHQTYVAKQRL